MSERGSFHHIGIACHDLERDERIYAMLGYRREGDDFDDARLGVHGVFITGPGPRIELVADRPGGRVVGPWIQHGSAVYHIAFETPDLARAVEEHVGQGNKVVVKPTPAVAFEGREVAFVMLRNRTLVELIANGA